MTTDLKKRAADVMPGGVNSPVRAFNSVGGNPIFALRGKGAYLETRDGRSLLDFCMSFGPLILGHAHPAVVEAVQRAAEAGTSYAVTTESEIRLAETLCGAFPGMERVRLVSSGTEACMTAIRLARGATGREKILKFSGCYHGHADSLLVKAGSGVAGIASASSAGVPESCAGQTLVARYNNVGDVEAIVREHGDDLAAVILEPFAGNMGLVAPREGFLQTTADLARSCGALVIFDEVITGFRLTFGGYQRLCDIRPDLTTLGKIIGGGMPIGAVGGPAELMEQLAPGGEVYQAGTLSGNPISVAAGLASLHWLQENDPYPELDRQTARLIRNIQSSAAARGIQLQTPREGSMFSVFFSESPVHDFDEVSATNTDRFPGFFQSLLAQSVYLPPSAFETSFLSTAHGDKEISQASEAFNIALGS
jgi:glutamate-1-semialdehyde 2,1-aminomutase